MAAQMSGEVRDERTNLVGLGVDARCVKCQAAVWASISAGPLAEPVPSTPRSHEPNELRMLRNQTTHVAPVDGSTSAISWRDNQCPLLPKPTC